MKRSAIIFSLLFLSLACAKPQLAEAQGPASPAAAPSASPAATSTTSYTLPPDKLEKSKALYDLRVRLRIVGTVFGFAVLLAILYSGVIARYRNWAERASNYAWVRSIALVLAVAALVLVAAASAQLIQKETTLQKSIHALALVAMAAWVVRMVTRRGWTLTFAQALIAVPLFLLTMDVPSLPLEAYQHSISRQYGLSVQGWGSWFGDQAKGEMLGFILGTVLLWLMIIIIRRSPKRWWFYFWLIACAIGLFLFVIGPYVIDPMFNKFEPLAKSNPQLVEAIEKVTARGGLEIPRERMFLMKASEKVTTLNAYVTGFGPSKRVVVWDTTIQKASTPETLFVFGHEMGHYVLNHVVIGLAVGAIALLIGLYLLYRVSGWFLRRFGQRWQIRELGDWAVLPMIFLIFGIFSFFATPLGSTFSRQLEHNADIYGLEVTHGINANSQEAGAHAFQVLGELGLSYPYPNKFLVFWYGDHPAIPDRVRFAHEYDPWSKGESPKYVK